MIKTRLLTASTRRKVGLRNEHDGHAAQTRRRKRSRTGILCAVLDNSSRQYSGAGNLWLCMSSSMLGLPKGRVACNLCAQFATCKSTYDYTGSERCYGRQYIFNNISGLEDPTGQIQSTCTIHGGTTSPSALKSRAARRLNGSVFLLLVLALGATMWWRRMHIIPKPGQSGGVGPCNTPP